MRAFTQFLQRQKQTHPNPTSIIAFGATCQYSTTPPLFSFSSGYRTNTNGNRGSIPIPQYQVQNQEILLSIRPIATTFKKQKNFLKVNQNGRLLMDFVPKDLSTGRPLWNERRNVALSPGEIGLFLTPSFSADGLEIKRQSQQDDVSSLSKILKIVPIGNGSMDISLEYLEGGNDNVDDQIFNDESIIDHVNVSNSNM